MKKTKLGLLIGAIALSGTAMAVLPEGLYIGGKIGFSNYSKVGDIKNTSFNSVKNSIKNNSFGTGLFVGYQLDENFAVEGGYDWLGEFKNDVLIDNIRGKVSGQTQGLSAVFKAGYNITQDFELYGKIGGFISYTKTSDAGSILTNSKVSFAPTFAIGGSYKITDNLAARLEYQWISGAGKYTVKTPFQTSTYKPNNGTAYLGLTYSF